MFMLRGLGAINQYGTPMQSGPVIAYGGVPEAPPTGPYGHVPGVFVPTTQPLPGNGGVIVTEPGSGLTPAGAMTPTTPGPVFVPPSAIPPAPLPVPTQTPGQTVPPPAGTQVTVSDDGSIADSLRAALTPVRIAAAAFAVGIALLGAFTVSRVRRRNLSTTD